MAEITGYELSVVFDTNGQLTAEESDALCEAVMDLFESSGIVSVNLNPIMDETEPKGQ